MNKKAIIFIDYNETFDDVCENKGNMLFSGLKKFVNHFDGAVEIAVITSAYNFTGNEDYSIKYDLLYTLTFFPKDLQTHFKYLIEGNSLFVTEIFHDGKNLSFGKTKQLSLCKGEKNYGVELLLKNIDPHNQIEVCVFAGNDENSDLKMMDSEIGNRKKYFILANRRILKTDKFPVYKLSMNVASQQFIFKQEDSFTTPQQFSNLIIKTSDKSFGVGKGLDAVVSILKEKER